ncbi:MAG: ABC transporter permease, partial [Gemmatimonadetes bacterium]|nr:ABC transporter permease [Gemmatimonadota bacterium]
GIGATTAIYSILQGSVLRPLPFPQPDRLVRVRDHYVPTDGGGGMSVPNFLDLRREAQSIEELVGYLHGSVNLQTEAEPARALALSVTTNFFRGLVIGPVLGRGFAEGEDREGAPKLVVIGDRLWRQHFGGRPDVLGETLRLNAEPYTVVGVLPRTFWFPGDPQIVIPFAWSNRDITENRGSRRIEGFALMKPGVERAAAEAELDGIFARLATDYPDSNKDWSIMTFAVRDWMLGFDRTSLWLLAGAVLLVLVIGCVNVANLMLVRAERRHREFAVRAAIGASRRHIIQDFLAESLLISGGATLLGIGVAWVTIRVLLALFGGALPRAEQVGLGGATVLFAAGLAILTGFAVGFVPALRTDVRRLYAALREGGHGMAVAG